MNNTIKTSIIKFGGGMPPAFRFLFRADFYYFTPVICAAGLAYSV